MIYAYRDGATAPVPVTMVMNFVGPASFEPSKWFGMDYTKDNEAQGPLAS